MAQVGMSHEEKLTVRDGAIILLLLLFPVGWLVLALVYIAHRWNDTDLFGFIETDEDRATQYEIERELAREQRWIEEARDKP